MFKKKHIQFQFLSSCHVNNYIKSTNNKTNSDNHTIFQYSQAIDGVICWTYSR